LAGTQSPGSLEFFKSLLFEGLCPIVGRDLKAQSLVFEPFKSLIFEELCPIVGRDLNAQSLVLKPFKIKSLLL